MKINHLFFRQVSEEHIALTRKFIIGYAANICCEQLVSQFGWMLKKKARNDEYGKDKCEGYSSDQIKFNLY